MVMGRVIHIKDQCNDKWGTYMCLQSLWSVLWFCNGQHCLWLNLWSSSEIWENLIFLQSYTEFTSPKPCQLNSFLFYLRSNPLDNMKVNSVNWCIQRLNRAAPCALSTMQVQPIAALEMRNLLFTIQINPLSAIDLQLHPYKVTFLYKIRYLFHNLP